MDFGIKGGPKPAYIDELATFREQESHARPSAPSQALTPR